VGRVAPSVRNQRYTMKYIFGTGHDGDIQAGATLAYTDNGDGTITDENTGLMWMKQDDNGGDCASYPGNLDKDCTFSWDQAFTFVASLNANNHGGHDDWRVSNVRELHSIVNYENPLPAVSDAFNTGCVGACVVADCSCTAMTRYWSSTSNASLPDDAWDVSFSLGNVNSGTKISDFHVRAVRGGL
jgi:hypothetical protein